MFGIADVTSLCVLQAITYSSELWDPVPCGNERSADQRGQRDVSARRGHYSGRPSRHCGATGANELVLSVFRPIMWWKSLHSTKWNVYAFAPTLLLGTIMTWSITFYHVARCFIDCGKWVIYLNYLRICFQKLYIIYFLRNKQWKWTGMSCRDWFIYNDGHGVKVFSWLW